MRLRRNAARRAARGELAADSPPAAAARLGAPTAPAALSGVDASASSVTMSLDDADAAVVIGLVSHIHGAAGGAHCNAGWQTKGRV